MTHVHKIAAIACAALMPFGVLAEEIVLKSVSAWPANYAVVKDYQQFIDAVNQAGKGIVRIDSMGGPEAIPADQQATAVRNGVVDIQFGAASYYGGTVPEADALKASRKSPVEARASGATALLSDIWRQRLNAVILGWQSGGTGFHIYLTEPPKLTPTGQPDLTGLKLRSSSAYKEWFQALGATNVMMAPAETFSAFERGMLDGLAIAAINFSDLGIEHFIKARIDPQVWQIDTLIIMNADSFDGLTPEARQILTDAAIAREKATIDSFAAMNAAEDQAQAAAGIQFVTLDQAAAQAYRDQAHDLVWQRLERAAPDHAAALRQALGQDEATE
ncbi:TRAP transporter substrate-binding protein DctP [Paracoccus sp. M683]|uniref:TRAP transporter substrate-binding protein DctP n=1 Tax=Paracoccus sp. M683 TaxID=2594268 RepID=UPI00163D84C1|nr:TRAP transporter substrate-binding protein DctP [Paracoccus sp. M683]